MYELEAATFIYELHHYVGKKCVLVKRYFCLEVMKRCVGENMYFILLLKILFLKK